MILKLKNNN